MISNRKNFFVKSNTFENKCINIISKKAENNSISASLSGGQYGFVDTYLGLNYIIGKVANKTSAAYSQSDGYKRNTDFNILNINHNTYYKTDNLLLDLTGST